LTLRAEKGGTGEADELRRRREEGECEVIYSRLSILADKEGGKKKIIAEEEKKEPSAFLHCCRET